MCTIPLVVMGVGTGLQLASGYQQAQAQKAAGQAEGNYYDYIAEQNKQQGEIALRRGAKQSEIIQEQAKGEGKKFKQQAAEFTAGQKVALAASGVPLSSVTAQDIEKSTMSKIQADELALRYNADLRSWGVTTDAKYQKWSSDVAAGQNEYAGRYSKYAEKINARNTILGTWSGVGQNLAMFGLSGGFKPLSKVFAGRNLGAGTTTYGVNAPSRYMPYR